MTTSTNANAVDLIGIGALNIDYIVKSTENSPITEDETVLTQDRFVTALLSIPISPRTCFLGGSAFNAVRTVASLGCDLKVGFIGVAGNEHRDMLHPKVEMAESGIDHEFVAFENQLAGGCIASVDDQGKRRLRTYPGVNAMLPELLNCKRMSLLDYVCKARIIHVSSLFDGQSAREIGDLLREGKRRSPRLQISFDPGDYWIKHKSKDVQRILSITDFLFVNQSELLELGSLPGGKPVEAIKAVFRLCKKKVLIIVVKEWNGISIFQQHCGQIRAFWHENTHVLAQQRIKDPTGAGDTVAGGILSGLLLPGVGISNGVELGLRLVGQKMKHIGPLSPPIVQRVWNQFLSAQHRRWSALHHESKQRQHDKVFISYSHKDQKYFDEFKTMLAGIPKESIDQWDDRRIQPGADWRQEIQNAICSTKVAVLLVSSNFLESDFIMKNELPLLVKAAKARKLRLVWFCLDLCLHETTQLGTFQAAHDISKPLNNLSINDRKAVMKPICLKIAQWIGTNAVAAKC